MHGRENCSRIHVLIQTPLTSEVRCSLLITVQVQWQCNMRIQFSCLPWFPLLSSPRKDFLIPGRGGTASTPAWTLPVEIPAIAITGCAAVDLGHYAPCPQAWSLPPCSSNSAHRTRWLDPGPEGESDTGAFSPERAASIMQGGRPPGATRAK